MIPSCAEPLKILYLADSTIPSRAANTVGVLNMCSGFAAADADVTLLARGVTDDASCVHADFGLDNEFPILLYPIKRTIKSKIGFLCWLKRQIRRLADNNTVVFGRSPYGLLLSVPAFLPMIYDVHAYPPSVRHRWVERLLIGRPNLRFVSMTTQALARKYEEEYPRLRGRTLVVPNGAPVPKQQFMDALEPHPARLQVYYVGHLYAGRGVDLILELARREPEIDFNLVGGEEEDVQRWRTGAPSNAVFHGYLVPSHLSRHYRRADICLAPYQTKVAVAGGAGDNAAWMSPLKLFEYMSQGKPIVASDLPSIREVLSDGEDALLCPPGDAESWQRAILRIRDDPGLRRRLSAASAFNATSKYTWQRRAEIVLRRFCEEMR